MNDLKSIGADIGLVAAAVGGQLGQQGLDLLKELNDDISSIFGNFHNPPPDDIVNDTNDLARKLKDWLGKVGPMLKGAQRSNITDLDSLGRDGNQRLGDEGYKAVLDTVGKCNNLSEAQKNQLDELRVRLGALGIAGALFKAVRKPGQLT